MSKSEVVNELVGRGYDARLENGIVMIKMQINNNSVLKIEKILQSIGYCSSWGIRNAD